MIKHMALAAVLLTSSGAALAQMRSNAEAVFEQADTNHDGNVSREEFIAARAGQFSKLDRNGDGYIDDQDLPKRMMAMQQANARIAELRQQFDANGDGRISQQEFAQGPTPVFDQADSNGDGVLNAQELAAAKTMATSRVSAMRQSQSH